MTFERPADGRWRVAGHTRTAADGRATPPVAEPLFSGSWRQNPCWQSLGKTLPPY